MRVTKIASLTKFNKALTAAGSKLVLVDFYADWCPPCRAISPFIKDLAKQNPNVVFLKVNVEKADELAAAKEISAMPTFQFYKDGALLEDDTVVGADENALKKKIADLQ